MFKKRVKAPADLADHLYKHLTAVLNPAGLQPARIKHHNESLLRYLELIQQQLYGDAHQEADQETVSAIVRELLRIALPLPFIQLAIAGLPLLESEPCGCITSLLCFLLRAKQDGSPMNPDAVSLMLRPIVLDAAGLSPERVFTPAQLENPPQTITACTLLVAYGDPGRAPAILLNAGNILHDALKFQPISNELLQMNAPLKMLDQLSSTSFDVSSGASRILLELLASTKVSNVAMHQQVSDWLLNHYDVFFKRVNEILSDVESNYLACRETLRLIGGLLFVPENKCVIVQWVSEAENLKMMMQLLVNRNATIQLEAFHIFKLFVANPKKPRAVQQILVRNRERFLTFFSTFAPTKEAQQEEFIKERQLVLDIIRQLPESLPADPQDAA